MKVLEKIKLNHDSYLFRFTWEDKSLCFGMPIGHHAVFVATIGGNTIYRKYTPISDISQPGHVDFLVKVYRPGS